jgi:hypothetical protein
MEPASPHRDPAATHRALIGADRARCRRPVAARFAEIYDGRELWEYALVTSRDSEILSLGQLYEAITSRPSLLEAIGRQTSHAGRTTVTIIGSHGEHDRARAALTHIADFFTKLRKTAEQLTALETLVPNSQPGAERISARTKTRRAASIPAGGSCQLWLRTASAAVLKSRNSRI